MRVLLCFLFILNLCGIQAQYDTLFFENGYIITEETVSDKNINIHNSSLFVSNGSLNIQENLILDGLFPMVEVFENAVLNIDQNLHLVKNSYPYIYAQGGKIDIQNNIETANGVYASFGAYSSALITIGGTTHLHDHSVIESLDQESLFTLDSICFEGKNKSYDFNARNSAKLVIESGFVNNYNANINLNATDSGHIKIEGKANFLNYDSVNNHSEIFINKGGVIEMNAAQFHNEINLYLMDTTSTLVIHGDINSDYFSNVSIQGSGNLIIDGDINIDQLKKMNLPFNGLVFVAGEVNILSENETGYEQVHFYGSDITPEKKHINSSSNYKGGIGVFANEHPKLCSLSYVCKTYVMEENDSIQKQLAAPYDLYAEINDGKVYLSFEDSIVSQKHIYFLERSNNKESWDELATLSTEEFEDEFYYYVDERPLEGTNHYRIKHEAFNGIMDSTLSTQVQIDIILNTSLVDTAPSFVTYPNPSQGKFIMNGLLDVPKSVVLVAQNGNTFNITSEYLHGELQLSTQAEKGVYVLHVIFEDQTIQQKIVIH